EGDGGDGDERTTVPHEGGDEPALGIGKRPARRVGACDHVHPFATSAILPERADPPPARRSAGLGGRRAPSKGSALEQGLTWSAWPWSWEPVPRTLARP